MHFGEIKITSSEKQLDFDVQVCCSAVEPDNVQVELFANGLSANRKIWIEKSKLHF